MSDNDKDGAKEQFAIASIILQLSQQRPAKRRKVKSIDENKPCNHEVLHEHCSQGIPPPSLAGPDHAREDKHTFKPSEGGEDAMGFNSKSDPSEARSEAALVLRTSVVNCEKEFCGDNREGGKELTSHWSSIDDVSSEGGGTYCASVSSGDDEKHGKAEFRRIYRCSKCGAEKKGHMCSAKIQGSKDLSGSLALQRGDLAARLAARIYGQGLSGNIGRSPAISSGPSRRPSAPSDTANGDNQSLRLIRSNDADLDSLALPTSGFQDLPYFRSFRASDVVRLPPGVTLSLQGSFVPAQ